MPLSSTAPPCSANDGSALALAMATLPREAMGAVLALLRETNLSQLLSSKVSDLVRRDSGTFQRRLADISMQLAHEEAGELLLQLLGELNAILDVPPRDFASRRDVVDNAGEIVAKACALLRTQDAAFVGGDLRSLVEFQTRCLFDRLGEAVADMPSEKKAAFFREIRDFVGSMPADQQEKLRRELRADELTDEILQKALSHGALGAAFATAVGVGNFAFYTGAVSLFGAVSGVIGVTLPFGFYTGLTSAIAIVSNPVFLLIAAGGGGWVIYSRQNRSLRERLVPLVVSQVMIASAASTSDGPPCDAIADALERWAAARAQLDMRRARVAEARSTLHEARAAVDTAQARVAEIDEGRKRAEEVRTAIHEELKESVTRSAPDIAKGSWGTSVAPLARELLASVEPSPSPDSDAAWYQVVSARVRRGVTALMSRATRDSHLKALVTHMRVLGTSKPDRLDPETISLIQRASDVDERLEGLHARAASAGTELTTLEAALADRQNVLTAREEAERAAASRYWKLGET